MFIKSNKVKYFNVTGANLKFMVMYYERMTTQKS